MTPGPEPFGAFSRRLDAEHLRARVRHAADSVTPSPVEDPAELSHALEAADPLGEGSDHRWTVALRELFRVWPGRVAVAATLGAVLVVGVAVGRVTTRSPEPGIVAHFEGVATRAAQAPPLPAYRARLDPGLAVGKVTAPASEKKFLDAMAQYGQPDFAQRALPLLREAAAADPRNDEAQFWLGVVLLRDGHAADAVAPLEAAARLAPAERTYKGYLLYAYLQTGAVERAQALQQELLRPR